MAKIKPPRFSCLSVCLSLFTISNKLFAQKFVRSQIYMYMYISLAVESTRNFQLLVLKNLVRIWISGHKSQQNSSYFHTRTFRHLCNAPFFYPPLVLLILDVDGVQCRVQCALLPPKSIPTALSSLHPPATNQLPLPLTFTVVIAWIKCRAK